MQLFQLQVILAMISATLAQNTCDPSRGPYGKCGAQSCSKFFPCNNLGDPCLIGGAAGGAKCSQVGGKL
ncbi:unnamed protein product [Zymoseptoria tritici ST99CH_3D7]|uniref:Chitin-binding type-1 domain-containing protein n=2 Tax=Zymoseptoria tritici TaxID=1047171 RepID=A0A1X7S9E9_ZYMT9|nr:unnamed protein product [Zymoseptoria tritici ST99CH_3D7]SMR62168.1 unnamed protein product [Zymoseptoria tritici ST99CH_1E4]